VSLGHVLWARQAAVDKALGSTAAHVLWALALHANRAGRAWPSADTLAEECMLHPKVVSRMLVRIEAAGLLEVRRRPGFTTMWTFPTLSTAVQPAAGVPLRVGGGPTHSGGGSHSELGEGSKEVSKEASGARGAYFLPGSGWIR
jgi:hypothetical protein